MKNEVTKLGKRGTVVIPVTIRKKLHLHEGDLMIAEYRDDGILLKPAVAVPIEVYNNERKAELLLSNVTNDKDYQIAKKEVEKMGLNSDNIAHHKLK